MYDDSGKHNIQLCIFCGQWDNTHSVVETREDISMFNIYKIDFYITPKCVLICLLPDSFLILSQAPSFLDMHSVVS